MPAPPPPPPPLPSFGFGGGPPPPPPPPPPPGGGGAQAPRPTATRGALNSDITKGIKLRKAQTNDRSAPSVAGKPADGPGPSGGLAKPPSFGAPPVPGGGGALRVPSTSAPRVPSGGSAPPPRPRASSGSYTAQDSNEAPPQLGGLFAGLGGMPKLRSRGGGVDTGASRDSTYSDHSDNSTVPSRTVSAPFRPGPGAVPRAQNLRPTVPPTLSASQSFRKPPPAPIKRPASSTPLRPSRSSPVSPPRATPPPPPPLPVSLAPRPPVAPFRKTPSPTLNHGAPNSAPPPPPPPPSGAAPRPPTIPRAPPPPPPPTNGTSSRPNAPPPPPPPANRRSWNDPSSFTLSGPARGGSRKIVIDDKRWKFKREQDLPEPRPHTGMVKVYRSGRGSSVPLNLQSLE